MAVDTEKLAFRSDAPPHEAHEYPLETIRSAELESALIPGASWLVVEVIGRGPVRFRISTKASLAFWRTLNGAMKATNSQKD